MLMMPLLTESSQKAYCAAVSLNNAGVSMLERGCLRQAHRTFQDATLVLKEVCRPVPLNEANALLQRASERLANPEAMLHRLDITTNVLSCDPAMPPSPAILEATMTPQVDTRPTTTTIAPVKIDLIHYDFHHNCSKTTGPTIESSIIIYNCGVTSFLLSQTNPRGTNYGLLLQNSYQFFNLSVQVSSSVEHAPEDEVAMAWHLVMASLAVRGLLQVVQLANLVKSPLTMIECDVDFYTQLHYELQMELLFWQSDTMLLMLFTEPTLAASA
jgi:hypothetical protein